MINAQFGLIDDHEIIEFIGVDKVYSYQDLGAYLLNISSGYGESRYRPTYYLLRLIETFIFQSNTFTS